MEKELSLELGDKITITALQLTLLVDNAIENYIEALRESVDNNSFITPDTTEFARNAVVEWVKDNPAAKEKKNG